MKITGWNLNQPILARCLSDRRAAAEQSIGRWAEVLSFGYVDIWHERAIMRVNTELSEYGIYTEGEL